MSTVTPLWTDTAWQAALSVYNNILQLPFLSELADGTLPRSKFLFYLAQDAHYLQAYSRCLAHVASRVSDNAHAQAFLEFASVGMEVERTLHGSFLDGQQPVPMSPACQFYTAVETAASTRAVCVEAAALLPCFMVYREVGRHILASATNLDSNPYAAWIRTYGDEGFDASTNRAMRICNELAASASDDERQEMTNIFVTCTRLEWLFWHSAYNQELWTI